MFESEGGSHWARGLNDEQRRAVMHGEGPLLVVAGAGTGKTRTLVCRVAHLLEIGVAPQRILLLTFTRRAAQEMLSRSRRMSGADGASEVWGGTFHATAHRLLRVHGRAVGLDAAFTVMDQADAADLMDLIRSDLGIADRARRFPRKDTLAAAFSRAVNSATPVGDVVKKHFPWCVDSLDGMVEIYEAYVRRKRDHSLVDYDDLLLYWNALTAAPGIGDEVAGRFDHILVDEYQDTNPLQADILRGMRRGCDNVMVVGDDAQSIYSFRAATVDNILDFPDRFPGTTVVKLEQNYRSTRPLLQVSNAVIAQATRRYVKELWVDADGGERPELLTCRDESHQTEAVCDAILARREAGVALRRQAVLFRASHHSGMLEIELARRNIPFVKYGGLRFLEAAHVKDMLCLLRILENPRDELGWFRILQLLEGIGPATARTVMSRLGVTGPGGSPRALLDGRHGVTGVGAESLEALGHALGHPGDGSGPAADIDRLRAFYDPVVWRVYEGAPARLADLEHLGNMASSYPTRAQFLADLTLDPPASTADVAGPPLLDDDYLVLSTIHSAKGCEWDAVYVIHAADGMIPSDMATRDEDEIQEELRLLYVALTRAKRHLAVLWPLRYYHRRGRFDDAHSFAQLTRFLPPPVRALFDEPAMDAGAPSAEEVASSPGTPATVDAFLERLLSR